MKKIYSIIVLMLCCFFAGCSDDDNNAGETLLKVVSAEVAFDCEGGAGVIKVASSLPISATSAEEWCQVVASENTVNVTVSPNRLISSRTAMVTINAGSETTQVPVYQLGDIFEIVLGNPHFAAKGGEATFHLKPNREIEFEEVDETWLTCSYSAADGQLTIKALPLAEGGKYRSNTFKVKSGIHEATATVTQINMTGRFACYIDGGKNIYGTCIVEETETDNLYKVTPTGSAYDAPYYAKYRDGQFVIYFGQYLGTYQHETHPYLYLCSYDKNGYLHWLNNIEYVASVTSVNADGDMLLVFGDNGSWSGQKVDGFYYGLFDNLLENGGSTSGAGVAAVTDLVWLKIAD